MKKTIILFGAIAIAILAVSSATAVPTTDSEVVKNIMEEKSQIQDIIDALENTPLTKGILDLILALLQLLQKILGPINSLLNLIMKILDFFFP